MAHVAPLSADRNPSVRSDSEALSHGVAEALLITAPETSRGAVIGLAGFIADAAAAMRLAVEHPEHDTAASAAMLARVLNAARQILTLCDASAV